ncbi:MAG: hypothetical protein HKN26_16060 [Acidimicrobiales bacterium]|nr:hypothetical protein [Acidimicrobiales bacterium]
MPLLVAGAPRSGTTWVAETLAAHPDLRLIHEPDNHRLWPAAARAKAGLGRHPVLPPPNAADTAAYDELWHAATAGADNQSRTASGPAAGLRLGWRLRRALLSVVPATAVDDLLAGRQSPKARFADAVLRLAPAARQSGERRPLIKTVHGAFALDHIAGLTTGPVVIVRRDPRNAVASWLDLGWSIPRYERDPGIAEVLDAAGITAPPPGSSAAELAWAYCLLDFGMAAAAAAHEDWVTLLHEDLCDEPTTGFRAAAAAVGLGWHEAIDEALAASESEGDGYTTQRVRSEQRDRWKSRLDTDQAADVEAIMALFPF